MSNQVTVKDLRQVAGALAIPGRSKMNKAQLAFAVNQVGGGKHQCGAGVTGAPLSIPNFGQVGGNPTPLPWQWYNPVGTQVGGCGGGCIGGGKHRVRARK